MDEVNIATTFFQNILSKIIGSSLKKALGVDPLLQFNDPIHASFDGDMVKVHLNLDIGLAKDDLSKLITKLI